MKTYNDTLYLQHSMIAFRSLPYFDGHLATSSSFCWRDAQQKSAVAHVFKREILLSCDTATALPYNGANGVDAIDAGGYSTINPDGDYHNVTIYTGLNTDNPNKLEDVETYVDATLHELGHNVFGFIHDENGDTKDGFGMMDYDNAYSKNGVEVAFSSKQQKTIYDTWGLGNASYPRTSHIMSTIQIEFREETAAKETKAIKAAAVAAAAALANKSTVKKD